MRLLAALSLLLCGSNWTATPIDHCDVVVDVSHWFAWGGNEQHCISGWFWEHSERRGVGQINYRRLRLHDMTAKPIREGVRVSERCRIVGKWMDAERTMVLPLRVEVIQGRTDQ